MLSIGSINAISVAGLALVARGVYMCWDARYALAARRWPTTKGRVLSGGIVRASKRAFKSKVRYEYTVEAVKYESERIQFGPGDASSYQSAASQMGKIMQGGGLNVYYDPAHPDRSCLIPGGKEFTLTGSIFLLSTGCFSLWFGLFHH